MSTFMVKVKRLPICIALCCATIIAFFVIHFARSPPSNGSLRSDNNNKYADVLAEDARRVYFKDKIVHLDLKGAPPKVEYMKSLFSLLHKCGATGVLVEYEDMLPLYDELAFAKNGYAYTREELTTILDSARFYNLKVIPLIQTFGHMEWILKQQKYASLREVFRYPQVLCPSVKEGQDLVETLLDQVVSLHPNIDTIHIGSDEAYYVGNGQCNRCNAAAKTHLQRNRNETIKEALFINQITRTAEYVKHKHKLKVLAWYDMFSEISVPVLQHYRLGELIEPVIWNYNEKITEESLAPGLFQRFRHIFPRLWAASAFKGAVLSDSTYIDVDTYLQNNLGWLQMIRQVFSPEEEKQKIQGIILTGWQRYDHFGPLCELLPNAMPSLAVNLLLVTHGVYYQQLFDNARSALSCTKNGPDTMIHQKRLDEFSRTPKTYSTLPIPLDSVDCSFDGANVYKLTEHLKLIQYEFEDFLQSSKIRWLNEYALKTQFSQVFRAENVHNTSTRIIEQFKDVGRALQINLNDLLFEDSVNEWLFSNIQVHIDKLVEVAREALMISKTIAFRNRPLPPVKLEF